MVYEPPNGLRHAPCDLHGVAAVGGRGLALEMGKTQSYKVPTLHLPWSSARGLLHVADWRSSDMRGGAVLAGFLFCNTLLAFKNFLW